jgi:hypothetical protein
LSAWTGPENLAPTRIRSPDRPARSESLYRLRYPGARPVNMLPEFLVIYGLRCSFLASGFFEINSSYVVYTCLRIVLQHLLLNLLKIKCHVYVLTKLKLSVIFILNSHIYREIHKCNVCGRNLIRELTSAASPRVEISIICKVRQKLGVSLPLLTCSPSA